MNEHGESLLDGAALDRDDCEGMVDSEPSGVVVPLPVLNEDPYNARKHGKRNIQTIVDSLRKFGQVEPLTVRKENMTVIGGNGRLQAMRLLGWESARIWLLNISELRAKELSVTLNRAGEQAQWDWAKLAQTLSELESSAQDFENIVTGFSTKEMNKIVEAYSSQTNFTDFNFGQEPDSKQPSEPGNKQPSEPDSAHATVWRVVVECTDQAAAQFVTDALQKEGYQCRAMQVPK